MNRFIFQFSSTVSLQQFSSNTQFFKTRSEKIKKKIFILFVTVRELDGRRSDAPVSVGL
jgi:hypothetical protein